MIQKGDDIAYGCDTYHGLRRDPIGSTYVHGVNQYLMKLAAWGFSLQPMACRPPQQPSNRLRSRKPLVEIMGVTASL